MDVAAPAHLAGVEEHVLRTQLHDHIGMRADEDAGARDVAQHGVQRSTRMSVVDRIDPDQRAVDPQQLVAQLVCLHQVVDRGLRVDALRGESGEQGGKAVVLTRRTPTDVPVTGVDDGDLPPTRGQVRLLI
jgi:hypothetical protein